jgi:LacI family transcriptional regulator
LAEHPDLTAIYNAGGGTSGIARALKESGRRIVFVAHEATDANKALLLDGTLDAVIDQNARVEAREALTTLIAAARGQRYDPVPPRLQLILRENLPTDPPPAG